MNEFYTNVYPPRQLDETIYEAQFIPELDAPITFPELFKILHNCKNGKAPGPDQVSNEFFKCFRSNWCGYLLNLFNAVLEHERVPRMWASAALTMIFKKGDKADPSNYRGIELVNNVTKIFTIILKERLERFAEEMGILPKAQMGFRKGRGCTECIFTLSTVIQLQLRLGQREVYAIFVDFRRAFDSIPHSRLWYKLHTLGISAKLLRIIKSLYEQATVRVRSRNVLSEEFQVTEGVLQGESLSPLLFLLFISDFEKYFRSKGLEGLNIDGLNGILMLLYADDTVILDTHA